VATPDPDVTQLLKAMNEGDRRSGDRFVDVVYAELRAMAANRMRGERRDHTLQPTALVNEAMIRLFGDPADFTDRAHFFGAAARAMERILVDHARKRNAAKRGGGARRVTFEELPIAAADSSLDVLAVHDALDRLEGESPELANLVRSRYFLGLTLEQISEMSDVSLGTCKRRWAYARAWLYEQLSEREKRDEHPTDA